MKGNMAGSSLHNMNREFDPLYAEETSLTDLHGRGTYRELILGINGELEQSDYYALFEYERWLAEL